MTDVIAQQPTDLFSLWPHQDTGIAEIERAWSSGIKSVCYQLPTGGGKSRVIRQIVDNHSAGKKIIYLIAHRSTLVKQLSDELDDIELKHGIIAAGYPHLRYRVQVCSIQTMVNRLDKLPEPEVLIIDECVTGDSIVQTENGPIRIEDLNKYNSKYILSYDGVQKVYRKVIRFIKNGNRNVLEIKTESDKKLRCTYDHLLLGVNGWEKAKNLKIGNLIFVNADVANQPDGINMDIPQYGCQATEYGKRKQKKNGMKITRKYFEKRQSARAAVEKKYPQRTQHMNGLEKPVATEDIVNTFMGMINDKAIGIRLCPQTINLNYTGLSLETHVSNTQQAEPCHQELPGPMVSHKKNGLNTKQETYHFLGLKLLKQRIKDTAIFQYAEDLKVCRFLLKFIMTSIKMVKKPSQENCLIISIKRVLHGGFAMMGLLLSTLYIFILRAFLKLKMRSYQRIFKIITDRVIYWKNDKRHFSILSSEHILQKIYYWISKITYQNACSIKYERIIGIKMCGVERVYDLEVERNHCYFSNGFLSHNCHHAKANSYNKIISAWSGALTLGVTATPLRLDGKSLSDIFDTLVTGPAMHDLIEDGYLSDYEYYAPDTVDMSGVHKRAGEFVQSEVTSRVDKRVIIGSAVEHYRRYADGLPGIACCVNIAHAEHVAEQFAEAGYRARAVHSKMDKKYIEESIAGLKNGTLDILSQCELLGEGVDIKGATVLIQLRPTASLTIFLQQVGRVLRFVLGKRAIILDHVGNWERHGLPDDNRDWNLDGRPVTAGDVSELKRCPGCLRPVKRNVRVCPHCGYAFGEDTEQELPKEVTGELINIRDRKLRGNLVIDIARRADTLQQAIAVAKEHGAKHTQAWHIWTHELKKSC